MRRITDFKPRLRRLRRAHHPKSHRQPAARHLAMTTFVREIDAELVAEDVEGVEDLELLLRGDQRCSCRDTPSAAPVNHGQPVTRSSSNAPQFMLTGGSRRRRRLLPEAVAGAGHEADPWCGGRRRGGCRGLAMPLSTLRCSDGASSGTAAIVLEDLRFVPNRLDARVGVPLRVRLNNQGLERHDLNFPSLHMPGLRGVESILEPGETRTITIRFDEPGTHTFICILPGHAAVRYDPGRCTSSRERLPPGGAPGLASSSVGSLGALDREAHLGPRPARRPI